MTKQEKRKVNKAYNKSYKGVLTSLYNNYVKMLEREGFEDIVPQREVFEQWCDDHKYNWFYTVYERSGFKKNLKPRLYRIGGGYSLENIELLFAKDAPKNGKTVVVTIKGKEYFYPSAGKAAKALGLSVEAVKKGATGINKTRCCGLRYGDDEDDLRYTYSVLERYNFAQQFTEKRNS